MPTESSLIQAMNEMEDQDNSEEVSSIPSAGPSSPLLPTAPREIPAGLHQQVECEPDMLFVPEEEVIQVYYVFLVSSYLSRPCKASSNTYNGY